MDNTGYLIVRRCNRMELVHDTNRFCVGFWFFSAFSADSVFRTFKIYNSYNYWYHWPWSRLLLLLLFVITCVHDTYSYIPESNHVSTVYSVTVHLGCLGGGRGSSGSARWSRNFSGNICVEVSQRQHSLHQCVPPNKYVSWFLVIYWQ